MKKILIYTFLFNLLFFNLSCKKNKNIYKDEVYNFTIEYPEGWKYNKGYEYAAASFIPEIRENNEIISIIVENIPPKMQPGEYVKSSKQLLISAITDFKTTGVGDKKVSDEVYYLEYTGAFGGVKLHWYQKFVLKKVKAYVFTYASTPEGFNKNFEYAKRSIESFKINEK